MARTTSLLDDAFGRIGPISLPGGVLLVVQDSLRCNGAFLLSHFMRCHLAACPGNRVCLLNMAQSFTHYATIARKQGYNLPALQQSGRFLFVDVHSELSKVNSQDQSVTRRSTHDSARLAESFSERVSLGGSPGTSGASVNSRESRSHDSGNEILFEGRLTSGQISLTGHSSGNRGHGTSEISRDSQTEVLSVLYRILKQSLLRPWRNLKGSNEVEEGGVTVIMVDDASLLEVVTGGSWSEVLDFFTYCRALQIDGERCALVVLVHDDIEGEDEPSLLRGLIHMADVVTIVEPLDSGTATDVHGQVSVVHQTARFRSTEVACSLDGGWAATTQLHFRISEGSVLFFRPGTHVL